jgi:hypothetical protein
MNFCFDLIAVNYCQNEKDTIAENEDANGGHEKYEMTRTTYFLNQRDKEKNNNKKRKKKNNKNGRKYINNVNVIWFSKDANIRPLLLHAKGLFCI